jgi:hypothetical protein
MVIAVSTYQRRWEVGRSFRACTLQGQLMLRANADRLRSRLRVPDHAAPLRCSGGSTSTDTLLDSASLLSYLHHHAHQLWE